MKIEAVEGLLAHTYLLVRIRTDNGIVGWGQSAYFSYPEAAGQVVERYQEHLVGKDPPPDRAPLARALGQVALPRLGSDGRPQRRRPCALGHRREAFPGPSLPASSAVNSGTRCVCTT